MQIRHQSVAVIRRLAVFLFFAASLADEGWAATADRVVKQTEDGVIKLGAADAQIQGANARMEGGSEKDIIWWTSVHTSLHWRVGVLKAGKYRIELTYAVVGTNNGSALAIVVGDQVVKAIPRAGEGAGGYQTGRTKEVTISEAGAPQIVLKPLAKSREFVIKIRSIALCPVEIPSEAIDISGGSIAPLEDGSFKLKAADADIHGPNAILEGDGERNIGFWQDVGTSLAWSINVTKPGKYRVELNYSLAEGGAGSKVLIKVGDQTTKAKPKVGKNGTDYLTGQAGEVTIEKTGELPLVVIPLSAPYGYVMNLRSVALVPAEVPTKAIDIRDTAINQAEDGSIELTPTNAEIDGRSARIEGDEKKHLVWWNNSDRPIKWPIQVNFPATFKVLLTYSQESNISDTQVAISVGKENTAITLPSSLGLDDYKTEKVGEVTINEPGEFEMVLKTTKASGARVMNLRSVKLVSVLKE